MGVETALLAGTVGLGAFQAVGQAKAGQQQAKAVQRQGEYNAQVYEQQAQMVLEQKKISEQQFLRNRKRAAGSIVAGAAGKGLRFSGSPLAIAADVETQLGFDKAIEDYNLDVERNRALSGASYSRETGRQQSALARATGYSNAFSSVLKTALMAGAMGYGGSSPSLNPKLRSYYMYGL